MIVTCNMPSGIRIVVGDAEIVLTPGVNEVDDAFWAEWFKDHEMFSPVVDGLIIPHPEVKEADDEKADENQHEGQD